MAGTGKSYWSKRLAEHGFRRFCCDDLIAAKIAPELRRADGTSMDMGEWMGFPFMAGYCDHEAKYLACEKEVLGEILDFLEGPDQGPGENVVVDTSGSVIYTGDGLLKRLGRETTIVYLSTPSEVQEQLLEAYLTDPHPMLWRGMFRREGNETDRSALARSYTRLFSSRQDLYKKYAHVTVDYHRRRRRNFDVRDFLKEILSG